MASVDPWDGNLPRLAAVWPLVAVASALAASANLLLAALAIVLVRRGVHVLHVAVLASAGAALAAVISVTACVDAAARRYVGDDAVCALQGGLFMFLGAFYSACLVHSSVRAYRLVVAQRRSTPREIVAFHAAALVVTGVASVLLAGAPGHSALMASRTYCFPAEVNPATVAAATLLIVGAGAPLVFSYVRLYLHARALRAATLARRATRDAGGPSVATAPSRVGLRAFVLVALFFTAFAPYDAMFVVVAVTGSPAPEALDLAGVIAVPLSLLASAVLQIKWHAVLTREAARWGAATLVAVGWAARAGVEHCGCSHRAGPGASAAVAPLRAQHSATRLAARLRPATLLEDACADAGVAGVVFAPPRRSGSRWASRRTVGVRPSGSAAASTTTARPRVADVAAGVGVPP